MAEQKDAAPRATHFEFGVREKHGIIGGLRTAQVVEFGASIAIGCLWFIIATGTTGFVLAVCSIGAGVGVATVPFGKRQLDQWVPIWWTYGKRTVMHRRYHMATLNLDGFEFATSQVEGQEGRVGTILDRKQLPASVRNLRIQEVTRSQPTGQAIGVVFDRETKTLTSTIAVRGERFSLMDPAEQVAACNDWAEIPEAYGLSDGAISRIQWIERQIPDDGTALRRYLDERAVVDEKDPARWSYDSLIRAAGPATANHISLISLQIDLRRQKVKRLARKVGRTRDTVAGGSMLLAREAFILADRLRQSRHIGLHAPLTGSGVAMTIRSCYQPDFQRRRNVMSRFWKPGDRDVEQLAPDDAWPRESYDTAGRFRSEGMWHITFWVCEWPRREVGPNFLAPLLLLTNSIRTISMTMQPQQPMRAMREQDAVQTSEETGHRLRDRWGFRTKVRHTRASQKAQRDEQELAEGHVRVRYAAYLTVSGATEEEVDAAARELEEKASQCRLELERLWGQQEAAFTYTLPLCRGLRGQWPNR